MDAFNYGEHLRITRVAKGFSQELIATRLNISQATYSRLESQADMPEYKQLVAIAAAMEVPLNQLMPPLGVKDYKALRAMQVAQMFLKTHFGLVIIFGAASALINSVFNFALGICDGYDTSVTTRTWVSWTAVLFTVLYLRYGYRKFIRMYKNIDNSSLSK